MAGKCLEDRPTATIHYSKLRKFCLILNVGMSCSCSCIWKLFSIYERDSSIDWPPFHFLLIFEHAEQELATLANLSAMHMQQWINKKATTDRAEEFFPLLHYLLSSNSFPPISNACFIPYQTMCMKNIAYKRTTILCVCVFCSIMFAVDIFVCAPHFPVWWRQIFALWPTDKFIGERNLIVSIIIGPGFSVSKHCWYYNTSA